MEVLTGPETLNVCVPPVTNYITIKNFNTPKSEQSELGNVGILSSG